MPLIVKTTRGLIRPGWKMKVLIYGVAGAGKTTWAGSAPAPLIGACETGEGHGLMPLANREARYVRLTTVEELDEFIQFAAKDPDSQTVVLDSVTAMCQTFVKDKALSLPRRGPESEKRKLGLPELDDYGSMGELIRSRVMRLLEIDKHVILTALRRHREGDPERGVPELIGPMLPGAAFEAVPGMVDHVFLLESRRKIVNGKSTFVRTLITAPRGIIVAKTRVKDGLHPELEWTDDASPGSFQSIYQRLSEVGGTK